MIRRAIVAFSIALLPAGCLRAQQASVPADGETLEYAINWPTGLPLGEARAQAKRIRSAGGDRWELDFTLDAAVPGFRASDHYRSLATEALCSLEFEKQATHGKKKTSERTEFDQEQRKATRVTLGGGGKSEIALGGCARDALSFLYQLRRELSQGRVPAPQTILFGAAYQLRLEYGGAQAVRVGDSRVEADKLVANLKGPASSLSFELFMARDAARTPLLVRVPLVLGTFSMELVR